MSIFSSNSLDSEIVMLDKKKLIQSNIIVFKDVQRFWKDKISNDSKHVFGYGLCRWRRKICPKRHPGTNALKERIMFLSAQKETRNRTVRHAVTLAQTLGAVRNYAVVIKTGPCCTSHKYLKYLSRKSLLR